MRFVVTPDAETAIRVVRDAIAVGLSLIESLQNGQAAVYEDEFGSTYIDPSALVTETYPWSSLGLVAAAEGLSLAFSDAETSAFKVDDLDWAAHNLRMIASELAAVGIDEVELPHDERAEHIHLAVIREVARHHPVTCEPVTQHEALRLRGSDLLDEQQRAAVNAPGDRDLLVNAGAGSGKTHMLSMRIARLVAERAVSAERCLVLTFSRAAREQIQDRLNALARAEYPTLARVDVRTIHSLGRRILQLASSAGKTRVRPGFQVITDGRRQLARGKYVTAPLLFIEQYERLFDGVNDGKSEGNRLALYPAAITALRMGHPKLGVVAMADDLPGGDPVTVLDPRSGNLADVDSKALAIVWGRYEQLMAARNAVDFAGMVTEALQAIRAHPALARVAAAPYEHVFVDEFQDTSTAQNHLLFELAAQGGILSCVGDGDQTIFSFAGADPRSLTHFAERLLERTGREALVMPLENNYRSVPAIVDAAEAVIARNADRLSKRMIATRPANSGEVPVAAANAPLRYAAPWLALQVRKLLDGGIEPSDIAVLFRKEGARSPQESAVLQHLEKLAVPVTTDAHDADGVRVVSVHQAKGSEFRHVLLLYLGSGHFPDDRGDSEEERRLLYVAMTRAKDTLVVAGEPGADPDLFLELIAAHPDTAVVSVGSLSDVLAVDAIDESVMGLTDLGRLDVSMLDWDEPEPGS